MGRETEWNGKASAIRALGTRSWIGVVLALFIGSLGAVDGPKATPQKTKAAVAHGDCRLCHRTHASAMSADGKTPAGKKQGPGAFAPSVLDQVCLECHQGPPVPAKDFEASKLEPWSGSGSSHVDGPFLERARTFTRIVDRGNGRKLVLKAQCDGCHDVHSKNRTSSLLPLAFDAQGKVQRIRPANASQVCFACHAGQEAVKFFRGDGDLGALMGPTAQSAHRPGATASARADLPSLRTGFFTGTLDCTSCHDNPNPAGPKGPHTSPFPHLLKASYGREGEIATAGPRANELCFNCHDRISIEGNQSFPFHAQHVSGFTGLGATRAGNRALPGKRAGAAPLPSWKPFTFSGAGSSGGFGQPANCATCHDPHGSARNPALVAFDPGVVSKSSVGTIAYQRTGLRQGSCTLSCHGYDHVQTRY
ncbi:MAG TPA: cytochrome c3 family protein [Holophagaceae bacterium]|nr:cytochrome c3 family protein [Holophagaceae bacterium]